MHHAPSFSQTLLHDIATFLVEQSDDSLSAEDQAHSHLIRTTLANVLVAQTGIKALITGIANSAASATEWNWISAKEDNEDAKRNSFEHAAMERIYQVSIMPAESVIPCAFPLPEAHLKASQHLIKNPHELIAGMTYVDFSKSTPATFLTANNQVQYTHALTTGIAVLQDLHYALVLLREATDWNWLDESQPETMLDLHTKIRALKETYDHSIHAESKLAELQEDVKEFAAAATPAIGILSHLKSVMGSDSRQTADWFVSLAALATKHHVPAAGEENIDYSVFLKEGEGDEITITVS